MKRKLYSLAVACLLFSCMQTQAQKVDPTGDWQKQASAWIRNKQSEFHALTKQQFAAVNAANSLCFQTNAVGYKVRTMNSRPNEWMASLTLKTINGNTLNVAIPKPTQKGNELMYHLPEVSIQYINEEKGFRQNFIVGRKPKSAKNLELAIDVSHEAALHPAVKDNQFSLQDVKGVAHLLYDDLKVWDANHNVLPARMELQGSQLHIIVDDSKASYPVTIDPLNHTPAWNDNGNGLVFPLLNDLSSPLLYGFSVSDAGDVNGDGYSDVIVGAPTYVDILSITSGTFSVSAVGAAFIYYGGPSGPAATPSEVLQPTSVVGALFGFSVSKAGDVNGDGYADVVVGAPGDRISLNVGVIPAATSVATGKVYVYYGGPGGTFDGDANTEPTVSATLSLRQSDFGSLLAVPVNPLYGFSVSNAGDVNGDGLSDIVVGSPAYLRLLPLPLRSGRVDIFHGSVSGISTTPSQTISGSLLDALFGFSVSTAGNVNGDQNAGRAISDIIVGAPGDLTFLGAGQAYVFHGSTSGITATSTAGANVSLSGNGLLTTLFGYSVSDAGDVNGDGYGDVIVGEPAALESLLTQTASVGAAKVFYGRSTGIAVNGATTLQSPRRPSLLGLLQGNLLFGFSVSSAGDVNCDGYSDVIIGEPGGTALSLGSGLLGLVSANVLSGHSYLFSGSTAGANTVPGFSFGETGAVSVANLVGYSVSEGGDFNGDGKADLLVGAPNGTLSLAGGLIPAVGSLLNLVTANSIGSAYGYAGCMRQSVLPLHLTEFTAVKQEGDVLIRWKADNDKGINRYIVERSADGTVYREIGILFGSNTEASVAYRLKDDSPLRVNYYRIKAVHQNGETTYSGVARVEFGDASSNIVSVLPNPVKNNYAIQLAGLIKGRYTATIYNASGAAQTATSFTVGTALHTQTMNRGNLAAGIYFIRITDASGSVVGDARMVCQ